MEYTTKGAETMRRFVFLQRGFRPVRRNGQRRNYARRRVILCLIAAAVILGTLNIKLRPVIKNIASSRAERIVINTVSDAVARAIDDTDSDYSKLVYLSKNSDGSITAIETNVKAVNELKAHINSEINKQLEALGEEETYIPVGSLTGIELFSGRGPKIKVKLRLYNFVITELKSSFEEAGINQTRHSIDMQVSASIYVVIPGFNTSTEVITNITVAETVIVGKVPDAYTSVIGEPGATSDIVNDYGAIQ